MKIAIIGVGYVGLVSGACFSEFGFNVLCIDKNKQKINQLAKGNIPIYEPGLDELVEKNIASKRLLFSDQMPKDLGNYNAIFIAVGTPSISGTDKVELSYVLDAAKQISDKINTNDDMTLIVTKSTVPVGTGKKIQNLIEKYRPELKLGKHYDIASNPEFLREGSAIEDFMRPDRIVCGVETEYAELVLKELYRPLNLRETSIFFTNRETAELIKYASNSFLATKITFINEIADICEKVGADVQGVAKGMGLDKRIGSKFLHPGPGYGGSCFPKDTKALVDLGKEVRRRTRIVESVVLSNESRKNNMIIKIKNAIGKIKDKEIAILGITFKPNTDDMRDSPSLNIVPNLVKNCKMVRVYDPVGMDNAKKLNNFKGVKWFNDTNSCIRGADAMIIITEWNEFRALNLKKIKLLLKDPIIVDLRNIYREKFMREEGFKYISVGRGKSLSNE